MKKGNKVSHMFAVCAYKESPYLEECINSLIEQSVQSQIVICTSTPNEYIKSIAVKYDIPLYIREGDSDIRVDWNFAYNTADADYVTIAHQDDVYSRYYVEKLYKRLETLNYPQDVTMYLTDYYTLKKEGGNQRDINNKIRRLLRSPLKSNTMAGWKWVRKSVLAFGNSICCPTATYNKGVLGESVFTSEYKFNIDWDTFLKLAKLSGRFVYVDEPLVSYRVHDGATSKEFIDNRLRIDEDTRMFNQFWPGWVSKLIMIFYKKAYDTYSN